MATVRPFRAYRPTSEAAPEVASVPYDVIDTDEARDLADGKPKSFLHVVRPEVGLPPGTDEHADAVYAQGAEALKALTESEDFLQEDEPALYVYRIEMNDQVQVGVFGLVSVAEYDDGTILKHENTRPEKEDDRTRHIVEQKAHAEPVMLAYPAEEAIDDLVDAVMEGEPLYDFRAADYVQHTLWKADDASALVDAFRDVEHLYVADGHHRCAAASRAAKETGLPEAGHFMAVLFPHEDLNIMAYNRVVIDLPMGPQRFLDQVGYRTTVEETPFPEPEGPGEVCVYVGDGFWYRVDLPETDREGEAAQLDVARLAEHILEPILHITDPRTDSNIRFIGGIRGTGELKRLVDTGEAELAISMYPTASEELIAVSDAGELMPPKSTWFEPKLRSGLLVHRFD